MFSQQKYLKALGLYRQSLDNMLKNNIWENNKLVKKVFDSIIESLNKSNLSNRHKKKWNKYIYTTHVKIYPIDDRSKIMYQKLYNIYHQEKKL